eukprot:8625078-Pyramimonas_sp.AAC.1
MLSSPLRLVHSNFVTALLELFSPPPPRAPVADWSPGAGGGVRTPGGGSVLAARTAPPVSGAAVLRRAGAVQADGHRRRLL